MNTTRIRQLLAFLAFLALLATPAPAHDKKKEGSQSSTKSSSTAETAKTGESATRASPTDDVEINPSSVVVVDGDFSFAALWDQPAAHKIKADRAHEKATGRDVVVAVLDGGFNTEHPLLAGRVSSLAYDAVDGDRDPNDGGNGIADRGDGVVDGGVGHGTAVAGLVLMAAPDATILPIRVVDDEGYGSESVLERGLAYAIAKGVDVINLSLEVAASGDGRIPQLLRDAAERGIVVVASAGNDGREQLGLLAGLDRTISVGAVDSKDVVADFSNSAGKHETLTVLAPGVELLAPLGWPDPGSMGRCSGTSFSAGIVSGAAALYRERHRHADAAIVRDALAHSVDPAYEADGTRAGPGRINLDQVVSQ